MSGHRTMRRERLERGSGPAAQPSLTPDELDAAMLQVANLVRTFGSSYSSTDMIFGN